MKCVVRDCRRETVDGELCDACRSYLQSPHPTLMHPKWELAFQLMHIYRKLNSTHPTMHAAAMKALGTLITKLGD